MYFLLNCYDKEASHNLRQATRPSHLLYLQNNLNFILSAGAILQNNVVIGTSLVLQCNSITEAESFINNDPYTLAKLFYKIDINEIKLAIFNKQSLM